MWLELCLSFWVTCLSPSPYWSDFCSSSLTNWFSLKGICIISSLCLEWFHPSLMTSCIFHSDFSLNVNNLESSIKYKLGIWFLSHHSILPFYIASFLLSDIDHAIVLLTVFFPLDCKFESRDIISHADCYTSVLRITHGTVSACESISETRPFIYFSTGAQRLLLCKKNGFL